MQYRVKCPSSQCGHIGMTDGAPSAGAVVKKHFADINKSKKSARAFLLKHGFITKDNKVGKDYR